MRSSFECHRKLLQPPIFLSHTKQGLAPAAAAAAAEASAWLKNSSSAFCYFEWGISWNDGKVNMIANVVPRLICAIIISHDLRYLSVSGRWVNYFDRIEFCSSTGITNLPSRDTFQNDRLVPRCEPITEEIWAILSSRRQGIICIAYTNFITRRFYITMP